LVSPEHHSWVFRSEGRVEDDVLNINNPFRKLVHSLVPFEKYAVPVGKVKIPGRAVDLPYASTFLMTKSGMGYGVNAHRLTFFPVARLRNL
jgi:hypothetical protein